MRKSKYLGVKFGEWLCTHVGVEAVVPAYKAKRDYYGNRVRNKYPGHQRYYYIFERVTHDGVCTKMVRLNAAQVRKVWLGYITVEEIADKKKSNPHPAFKEKVSYSFNPGC